MTDNWLRSPIQGLGSCEMRKPCSTGRFAALFGAGGTRTATLESASVTGVKKVKPFGHGA